MRGKKVYLILLSIFLLLAVCIMPGCKKKKEYRNIRITEITGDVTVNRDGQTGLKAYVNMNLQSEDELITEKGAKVTLRLDDDKYIIVDEDSKLLLIASGTEEDSTTRLELEYGAVFSDIKDKLSEESDYEVVTPSGVMSVRGTQFEVVYRELKDEAGNLLEKVIKVLTFEGEVSVKPEGSKEKRVSKAGTMEILTENEEGTYTFAGETKRIEAEDLSELSATYLKEDLSENGSDLPEEEKAWKEELLEKVEEYFARVSAEEEVYNRDEHLYQCVPLEGRNWEEIKAYCEEAGGHLATIMCAEENEYVYEQMVQWGFDYAYIGYTDEETEGEWKWVTGEVTTYENFYAEDVDNFREEDYAMLWSYRPYYWNDGGLKESSGAAFVVEWDMENGVLPTPIPTPTPEPTSTPEPTATPEPTPTPEENPEPEDSTLNVSFYFPKLMQPLESYQVSGMEELYEALEPYTRSISSPDEKTQITLQEEMYGLLNEMADTYVEGECEIKTAAEAVLGKEVIITCEGFYSEGDGSLLYSLEEHCSFAEFGVTSSYLTLYPVYTVYVPEDAIAYRYVPSRLMIETEEDYHFYTFMVQAGTSLGLPQVEGYNMYWMTGDDKNGMQRQDIMENQLSWPIILGEKQ